MVCLICSCQLVSQANIFTEAFDDGENSTSGTSDEGIGWSTDCPFCIDGSDYFDINNGELESQDVNGPATFLTDVIDVSHCSSIAISLDYSMDGSWGIDLETSDECPPCAGDPSDPMGDGCDGIGAQGCWDFIWAQLLLDGNEADSELIGEAGTDSSEDSGTINLFACTDGADDFEFLLTTQNWAAAERMNFDNIVIICFENDPIIEMDPDVLICQGGSYDLNEINVDPSKASQWDWSGPNGFSASGGPSTIIGPVTSNDSGTYTVTVTDVMGCEATGDLFLDYEPLTVDWTGPDLEQDICLGECIEIELTISGGMAPYTIIFQGSIQFGITFTSTQPLSFSEGENILTACLDYAGGGLLDGVDWENSDNSVHVWDGAVDFVDFAELDILQIRDANGCETPINTDSYVINLLEPVEPEFDETMSFCENDLNSYSLPNTSIDGFDGSWSPNGGSFTPNSLGVGSTTFTFTPDADACAIETELTLEVVPEISYIVSNIDCQDNGTPSDPSDDVFTFDLFIDGNSPLSSWVSDDASQPAGGYGNTFTFGAYPIADGSVFLTIEDATIDGCGIIIEVTPPSPCSDACDINAIESNIDCDDSGTPTDPSDDTFSFDIFVSGVNTGFSWTANDPDNTAGVYEDPTNFSGFSISDGTVSIIITDISDPSCTTTITIDPPNTCSDQCQIDHIISNLVCNNEGTPSDDSDDTFSFEITVSGNNTGSGWTADDPFNTSGAYDATVLFGPYPITGGSFSFTITDDDDNICDVFVDFNQPPSCSTTCSISNNVTNVICDDNGTPSDPDDDTFTFDVFVSGLNTGSAWTSDDPDDNSGLYGANTTFGPYNIIDGDLIFTITDFNSTDCTTMVNVPAPMPCSDLCDIDEVVTEILCDDNGTPSDPSDDIYYFDVEVTGLNTGTSWTANDPNSTSGSYNTNVTFGPYNIGDGTLNFTITDGADNNCSTSVMINPPLTCSDLCDIEAVASNIVCNDNGTPSDPADDTFSFDFIVNGVNTGTTWSANDIFNSSGAYGTMMNLSGYLIGDGDLNLLITDDQDPSCTTTINIQAPSTCSDLCDIEGMVSNTLCDDNGTPSDPSDDTFTFDLFVDGMNTGSSWSATDPNSTTGTYNSSTNFGPYPISGGDLSFSIVDGLDPSCTTPIMVTAPMTCSDQCDIEFILSNVVCNNAGTPSDDTDDTYTFDILVMGSNTGASWTANDPNNTAGSYNTTVTFGPFDIAAGDQNFTISDIIDGACSESVMVVAPNTCSTLCSISNSVSNIQCNDNGTPSDPDDDTFSFELIISGLNIGANWDADDPNNASGLYGVTTVLGPYNISDGILNFTVTDDNDPDCTTIVNVMPPSSCSDLCVIDAVASNIQCNDNGTPSDPADDTFTFDVLVTGLNTGSSWNATDPNATTGSYNITQAFGPYLIANGDLNFTIIDANAAACTTMLSVSAPASCSDLCDIEAIASNVVCDDNGTPSDPTDDTFAFDLIVNGANTGTSWSANDIFNSSGAYSTMINLSGYLINDGDLNLLITDDQDPSCTTTINIQAPSTCSDLCNIEGMVSNIVCDDNGTPSDPADDTFTFDLFVDGMNTGSSWSATDPNSTSGTYNNSTNFGPYPISGGDLSFSIVDGLDPSCTTPIMVTAPMTCSDQCDIEFILSNVVCNNAGTPSDDTDDTFTFDILVTGSNTGTSWIANDPNNTTGSYNTTVTFGPFDIAAGNQNFTISDIIDGACAESVIVIAPNTCSTLCSISNTVSNIQCDDNGTPSDPADDTFTFELIISGLNIGANWNADDPNDASGLYGVTTILGPYNISDGILNFSVTDDNDPDCTTIVSVMPPSSCSDLCVIDAVASNIICDDNGTPSDPADDTFTFDVLVTGLNTGSSWNATDPNATTGSYNITQAFGPYLIANGDLNFTIIDANAAACTTMLSVAAPASCSDLCDIEAIANNVVCNDNGTPSDPSDDTFAFDLIVDGANTGTTWSANDIFNSSGAYGTMINLSGYLISDGDLNLLITDDQDPNCTTTINIQAPSTCSDLCDIEGMVSNIQCDDNGTPSDPADDTFTFDLLVNGMNTGSSWSATDPNATSGAYNNSTSFGPYLISGGDLSFSVVDGLDPSCTEPISVMAPMTCSDQCDLEFTLSNIVCDNAGTPSDDTDDTYTFDILVTGSNTGTSWTANDPNNTTGSYNTTITFGPFDIADGNQNFTISDIIDGACSVSVIVIAPNPCSTQCSIANTVSNIQCDDNGTPSDPTDDLYFFDVTVSGSNLGSGWNANDPLNTSGNYNVAVNFGPYQISDGILNFTLTDNDDNGCTTIVSVTPPATCSGLCEIEASIAFLECNDNGTPFDPDDDTFSFDLTVIGSNVASSWTSNDPNSSSGSYNNPTFMGPYDISDGNLFFTITDGNDPNCQFDMSITAPDNCSESCTIDGTISNLICDDNGTPTDPSDDTFTFEALFTGNNNSTNWNSEDASNSFGSYNTLTVFGPYDIADGMVQFLVFDDDDPNCFTMVEVMPPATCSDDCLISSQISEILCDDNGTPTDPTDDTFSFDVELNGINISNNWAASDPNNTFGSYDNIVTFGPYPISGGNLSFFITDLVDANCFVELNVEAPLTCSNDCNLEYTVTNIQCDNNGTLSDDSDDLYTFDIVVLGTNAGTSWSSTDVNGTTGNYDITTSFGPFEIANGNQNFMITDDLDPNCSVGVLVQAPNPCSTQCSISNNVSNIQCDNNGTPSDPSDDTFSFEINVSGSNTGSSWTANDPNNSSGTYNSSLVLGPFDIASGILNFVITDSDNNSCTTIVSIIPPATCSALCELEVDVMNLICDDNSTSDPLDDLFTFELFVTGQNTGSSWSADDPNNTSGSYGTVITMGPYLITDGNFDFILTDGLDGSCLSEISIEAPQTCSEGCNSGQTEVITCDDGNACTIDDVMTILSSDGTVCEPCAGTSLDCNTGSTTTIDCDDGDPNTENDQSIILDCDGSVCQPCMGTPIGCNLMIQSLTIDCDDNNTPNDLGDDFIIIELSVSGGIGANFSLSASNTMSITDIGTYDMNLVILLDPGSAGNGDFDLTIIDQSDPNCNTTINILDPGPCSADNDCDTGSTMPQDCDDNNPCTINDFEIILLADGSICEPCSGEPIDCSSGSTTSQACDDGDPSTMNDTETILDCDGSICIPCAGIIPVECNEDTFVQSCDDGDPCTSDDIETVLASDGSICIPCMGEIISCDEGPTSIQNCDDGNPLTINDIETILDCDGSVCVPCQGESESCIQFNKLFLPNVLAVGTNGPNSFFSMETSCEPVNIINMSIYNRWGNLIYKAENVMSDDTSIYWDGRYNGQFVEPGVFVYMILLDDTNINKTNYSGSITVIR